MTSRYSRLLGTGGYLPDNVLTNKQLADRVETSDEWIVERTGIRERRIAADHETASTMGASASLQALEAAGLVADDIDLIIVGTSTSERVFPSTACLVQEQIGNRNAAAFDVQAACSGFVFALSVADKFIRTGAARNALVIGSECCSRFIDWTDRSTCILFGDGAGAVVLGASDEPGILSTHLHSDGFFKDMLSIPNPGMDPQRKEESPFIKMQGNEVFKVAVNTLEDLVEETLRANGLERSEIDWLVPHQANIRIISATARKLKMPMERVVMTIESHGNTSAASIPLALNVAIRDGRIIRGQTVLMEAFGGGFAWGSALLRY